MTDSDLKVMEDAIARSIKTSVNGKIDYMQRQLAEHNERHEADMLELKPYLQAINGFGILYKLFMSLGAVAIAWASIKSLFPNI